MGERRVIVLACTECNSRNYVTTRKPQQSGRRERLELKKFCRRCRKHTLHRETK
ncbi:MAG: 50S ribosomal protein L33 [Armatimonadota bacterium]|nr:50S ribosomal protein L33 [Armatimonadota bacterium]MCX7777192.1 50S ribosomal protein L33 [Armatimonadota bacterium]MDW8025019.1 50S ribosomal protein L33 [Armatimonadota bacterium]